MIRSSRIPLVLNRICDKENRLVKEALLVTVHGELLGATTQTTTAGDEAESTKTISIESLGSLVADIANDYQQLGQEMIPLVQSQQPSSTSGSKTPLLKSTLLLELELGLIAVATVPHVGGYVVAIAPTDANMGQVQARVNLLASHIQEALQDESIVVSDNGGDSTSNSHHLDNNGNPHMPIPLSVVRPDD